MVMMNDIVIDCSAWFKKNLGTHARACRSSKDAPPACFSLQIEIEIELENPPTPQTQQTQHKSRRAV